MKTLTLAQPHASLLAFGVTHVATRPWSTAYRGPLAIHAGNRYDHDAPGVVVEQIKHFPLQRGVVVASARLVDVVRAELVTFTPQPGTLHLPENERALDDFSKGRYVWLLTDTARTIERCPWCWAHGPFLDGCPVCFGAGRCFAIPARGQRGLWEWTPSERAA